MTLYPDVQKKAQAELDAVVGTDRLPSFEDKENLPYVSALCSEVIRWLPVAPLGTLFLMLPLPCLFTPNISRSPSPVGRRRIQWVLFAKRYHFHSQRLVCSTYRAMLPAS